MTNGISRRDVIAGAVATAATSAVFAQETAPLTRLAFGACARQNKEQPIWEAILAVSPQLYISLGDAMYADTKDPAELLAKYALLAEKPGFAKLKQAVPQLAIWDDHDYGQNDSGIDNPIKNESRAAFCDFWGEPPESERRTRADGIYTSTMIGPPGQEVQFILPDLRWNRTKLRRPGGFPMVAARWVAGQMLSGREISGPYREAKADDATMLGEAQWAWLEAEFAKPAALRIFCSSLQVLSDGTGWEAWENYPKDAARLEKLIGAATNVVILSGDVHYGELQRKDRVDAPPLWELTSSGLTESDPFLPNKRRVKKHAGLNFGVVEIDWVAKTVDLQVRDAQGAVSISERVAFA